MQFFKESSEEIAKRKELASHSIEPKEEKDLETNSDSYFEKSLDFPKRPPWDFSLGKEKLEAQEQRYFTVCSTSFITFLLIDLGFVVGFS